MESLPPELFENIFSRLNSPRDRLALRLVNRFFNARFTPPAFNALDFEDGQKSISNLPDIAASRIAPYVKNLYFDLETPRLCKRHITSRTISSYARTFRAVNGFTNALSLAIHLPIGVRNYSHLRLLQGAVLSGLTLSPTSITITNLQPRVLSSINNPEFGRFLGRLTHLSITVCSWPPAGNNNYVQAFLVSFGDVWLRPTLPTLETLELTLSCRHCIDPELPVRWDQLEFTKLRRLQLSGFQLSGTKGAEGYIVGAPGLQELLLMECSVPAYRDMGWAHVFEVIRERLMGLGRFEVEFPLRYGPDPWHGYQGHAEDEKALNALWKCIGQGDRVEWGDSWRTGLGRFGRV